MNLACQVLNRVLKNQYVFIPLGPEVSAFLDNKKSLRYHFQFHHDWASSSGLGYSVEKLRKGCAVEAHESEELGKPKDLLLETRPISISEVKAIHVAEEKKYERFKKVTVAEMEREGIFPAAIGLYNPSLIHKCGENPHGTGPAPNPEFFISVKMEGEKVVDVVPYRMMDVTEKRGYLLDYDGTLVTQGKCGFREGLLEEQFDYWMHVFDKVAV